MVLLLGGGGTGAGRGGGGGAGLRKANVSDKMNESYDILGQHLQSLGLSFDFSQALGYRYVEKL